MGKFIDLTGRKFGRLTVEYLTDERRGVNKEHVWHCKCECGNECNVVGVQLRSGGTKSCGCLKKESDNSSKNAKDMLGKKYGHLTVIERAGSTIWGEALWKCQCDCGINQPIVSGRNLRIGHTTSCGCDRSSQGEKKVANLLLDAGIPFSTQKRFSDLGALSFDFYVNNTYLIEYDGETHFMYNLHGWHNKEQYEAQKARDEKKNAYCLEHNIPLIRIPYTRLKDLSIEDLQLDTTSFLITKNN